MSFNLPHADPSLDRASRSRPRVSMPPPPVQMTPHFHGQFQQLPHEPNASTMSEYGFSQPIERPHVNMPMPGTDPLHFPQLAAISGLEPQHFPIPSGYDQDPPGMTPIQSSDVLQSQFRNMILSNNPSTGHQRTPSTYASVPGSSSDFSASSPHGNFRGPNQAQWKLQAQQMQAPPQYTQVAADMANVRYSAQLSSYGQRPPVDRFDVHQQQPSSHSRFSLNQRPPVDYFDVHQQQPSNHSRFSLNQRQPYGAVPQPRSLFDPNARSNRGRGGNLGHRPQADNNQAQLQYIDQLAINKIPEVQISPEEYSEKQSLKERLNDICRKVILDHELQLNAHFPHESVELKCFGSLSIGFATKESDMDLVLVSPESKPELSSPESPIPRMVEGTLMELGYGARLLTQTRVPIIKFCEKPGPELAAHLRLIRLQWEKEHATLNRRASNDVIEEPSSASAEKFGDLQSQDTGSKVKAGGTRTSSQSSLTLNDLILEDTRSHGIPVHKTDITMLTTNQIKESRTEGSVGAPTKGKEGNTPPQEKLENDSAWLRKLSDYELIGLFRTAIKENRFEPHQRAIIMASLESLESHSASETPEVLRKNYETLRNMPNVIRKCRVPTREDLEFPKSGVGTHCDINFSNQLALHNSLLLKCYSLCDPRVRQMVLFVKAWTKIRKINSPYHGTLNSYGYVLMVLHFLMNVAQPPVIPNLQLATDMIRNDPLSSREVSFDGYNIQFFRNEAAIEDMARNGGFGQNKESLGSLLRSFFQFYANPPFGSFSWKDDVLSLRTRGGILTKLEKGWVGARTEMVDLAGPGPGQKKVNHHYVVAIEDPFETGHNVARTVFFNGVVAIRDEFRRAADLISHSGVDPQLGPQDFFAEGKKNENLQHRTFPPRKDARKKKDNAPARADVSEKASTLKKDAATQKIGNVSKEPTPREAAAAGKFKVDNQPPKPQKKSASADGPANLPAEVAAPRKKLVNLPAKPAAATAKKQSSRRGTAPRIESAASPFDFTYAERDGSHSPRMARVKHVSLVP